MRALVLDYPRALRIVEMPTPNPGEDEVLVEVKASGLCGTDVDIYAGINKWPLPCRLGHEYSGEVIGHGGRVKDFKEGDRVVGENLIGCGQCCACRAGDSSLCESAFQFFESHAQYVAVPERSLHRISSEVEWDLAALIEPLAVAYSAASRAEIGSACTVAILGDGGIGLSSLLVAKAKGASMAVVTGIQSHKLELAKKLGADVAIDVRATDPVRAILDETGGLGTDCTIVAAGWATMISDAMRLTRRGGHICFAGLYHGIDYSAVNPRDLVVRAQTIRGNYGSPNVWPDVVRMVQASQLDPRPLVTHVFSLDDANEAFRTAQDERRKPVKIIMHPN